MTLLTTLVNKLPSWPKGTEAAINSRYGDIVYFYRLIEGVDYGAYEAGIEIKGSEGEFEHVTRQEWLEGRVKPDIADHLSKVRGIAAKRNSLENHVEGAKDDLLYAQAQLIEFEENPQNNIYTSLEEAHDLENILYDKAYKACQAAYSCGESLYTRKCLINGVLHEALLYVEYYQYSEEYYDVRDYTFEIVKI